MMYTHAQVKRTISGYEKLPVKKKIFTGNSDRCFKENKLNNDESCMYRELSMAGLKGE